MMEKVAELRRCDVPRRVLVVGLGATGLACARHLAARGCQVAVTDSREQPPGLAQLRRELPDVGLFLGGFDAEALAHAELLVVSPGVPLETPEIRQAMARGVPVVGDVELFAREVDRPVAAITGSNGKSTVTTLVGLMARAAGLRATLGGNLGEPVLNLLAEEADLHVIELSSFQLETTFSLTPAVATVLNLSPDHLDRYPSFAAYAETKGLIYERAEVAVRNLDDPLAAALSRGGETLDFTLEAPAHRGVFGVRRIDGEPWLCRGDEPLMAAAELLIPGLHNRANALAALAMGHALALPLAPMLQVLRTFPGLPHRTRFVAEVEGVRWYDDSKGTNPGATIAALEGLAEGGDGRTLLIAGGQAKGADFTELGEAIRRRVAVLILLGEDRERIAAAAGDQVPTVRVDSMEEAVAAAADRAQPGDRVLLSPACASFDQFRNYEHRGQVFQDAVGRLAS